MSVQTDPAVRTPPLELSSLDFLLGHHRCVGTPPADGSPATVMYMHGEPTLGGHYYNVNFFWPGAMAGRWIFGWNPLDGEYNIYYLADSGSQGTAVSAGWADGEFTITGSYTVVERKAHKTVRDVFTVVSDEHFTTRSFVRSEAGDAWIQIDVFDAHRITAEQAREENPDAHH